MFLINSWKKQNKKKQKAIATIVMVMIIGKQIAKAKPTMVTMIAIIIMIIGFYLGNSQQWLQL